MLRNRYRRGVASVLIVLGVVVMLFAPDSTVGLYAIAVGVVLELIGIALERRPRG